MSEVIASIIYSFVAALFVMFIVPFVTNGLYEPGYFQSLGVVVLASLLFDRPDFRD